MEILKYSQKNKEQIYFRNSDTDLREAGVA